MTRSFLRRSASFAAAFALFVVGSRSSANAPSTPSATTPTLEAGFTMPPDAARPWVYWYFMDGNFTREGVTADLEAMKRAGIGGVIMLEVNVGVARGPVDFMSPQWKQLFAYTVHECERLGIAMTTGPGPGWTGSGGPWIKPAQAMQHIVSATLNVTGPRAFNGVLPRPTRRPWFFGDGQMPAPLEKAKNDFYRDIRVLAFPTPQGSARIQDIDEKALYVRAPYTSQMGVKPFLPAPAQFSTLSSSQVVPSGQVADITDKLRADGSLNWQVPPGDWTIMRLGATDTGATTRPAPVPGLGLESDKLSKAGLDAQFDNFIQPLLDEVGPRKVTPTAGWNNLHIDSWEMSSQNWTPQFASEFMRRRGYDPTCYLPALSGLVVDSPEVSERFLWDWRQTANELVIENHAEHLKALGRQHNFGLSIEPYDMNPSSDMNLGRVADVPMGEFWLYGFNSAFSVFEAVGTGHTNGRSIIGAESFTSDDREAWRAYPGFMKELGDWALTTGINRFAFHRYQHQPALDKFPGMTMGPYGVHWESTQTWWDMVPAYHRYLARCQFLLRRGLPVTDVCYLVAEGAPQVFRAPASALRGGIPANGAGYTPTHLGYNFDACAPIIVQQKMSVRNGRLILPDGMSYGVLVLPERATVTPALLRKIAQLVQEGATVIGPRPKQSPSLADKGKGDAEVARLAAQVWGNCDGLSITQHAYGKGRVIWQRDLGEERAQAGEHPWSKARWIWSSEGNAAQSAPVEMRVFRRTVRLEDVAHIASARVYVTADNEFDFAVNGKRVGSGTDFHEVYSLDTAPFLKNGTNLLTASVRNVGDAPNPAGFIATLRVTWRDGHVQDIPTDTNWEVSSPQRGSIRGGTWSASRELGNFTMGPWNVGAMPPTEQYGDFAIAMNALHQRGITPDFESNVPVRFIHRYEGTTDLYFVASESPATQNVNCTFRVTGKAPELWNPQTGERRLLPLYTVGQSVTTVPLRFAPFESWFVVFKPSQAAYAVRTTPATSNFPTLHTLANVTGAWQVSFDPRWGGPAQVTFPTLQDWTQRPEPGIRFYSGQATYRKTLTLPQVKKSERIYLDLGTVNNLARVRLNGRDLGVAWCAPWQVELTSAMKAGANRLEITVANLWPNRLIGDQSLPPNQRLTSTTWSPYTKDSPLLPSGLVGPVRVMME